MRISRKTRRKAGESNLIPLINIVFLILVLFMIMGRVTPLEALAVDPPASRHARPAESGGIVVLLDPDGRFAVNSERVDRWELSTALSEWLGPAAAPVDAKIVVKADGDTRFEQLDDVLKDIREFGVTRISLVTDTSR